MFATSVEFWCRSKPISSSKGHSECTGNPSIQSLLLWLFHKFQGASHRWCWLYLSACMLGHFLWHLYLTRTKIKRSSQVEVLCMKMVLVFPLLQATCGVTDLAWMNWPSPAPAWWRWPSTTTLVTVPATRWSRPTVRSHLLLGCLTF